MTTAIGAYATATALKVRANITDTTDDTLLGTICDQINAYIESECGRVIAPVSGTPTRVFDMDEASDCLFVKAGVRTVTLLEIAPYTNAAYETVAAADYYLRPLYPRPGWPYTEVELGDVVVGSYLKFPRGFETVRITGTFGWAAIPDEITDVALTAATRAWQARLAGQSDIVGTDDFGRPLVSRFFSSRDRGTLQRYAVDIP